MSRTTTPPSVSVRLCPACARRDTMIVDPACPICDGLGALTLGRLVNYTPQVVADAVELALEAAARAALVQDPAAGATGAAAEALRTRMQVLRNIGIISKPATSATTPVQAAVRRPRDPQDRHRQATRLANLAAGPRSQPGDRTLLATEPLDFMQEPRPADRGGIPGFSAAGYVCAIARSCDPYDPLGRDARLLKLDRDRRRTQVETLVLFATESEKHAHRVTA